VNDVDLRNRVKKIVADLFINGIGEKADRLVLTSKDGRDLGEWCEQAIVDRVTKGLAEYPADDEEPVTHQWIRRVGFTRGKQAASTSVLSLWSERNHISIEIDDWYVRVAIGDSDVSEYLPAGFSMQTRGDVRRLCAALGIELNGG